MSTQPDSTPQATAEAPDKGVGCDALLALLRSGPKFDYDGYKAARLMQQAADEIQRLRAEYKNLLGQVVQARDGFGIYHNSPSMAKAIEDGEAYFFGANVADEGRR